MKVPANLVATVALFSNQGSLQLSRQSCAWPANHGQSPRLEMAAKVNANVVLRVFPAEKRNKDSSDSRSLWAAHCNSIAPLTLLRYNDPTTEMWA